LALEANRQLVERAMDDGLADLNKVGLQERQNIHHLRIAETAS
jgi:hypothetical protein